MLLRQCHLGLDPLPGFFSLSRYVRSARSSTNRTEHVERPRRTWRWRLSRHSCVTTRRPVQRQIRSLIEQQTLRLTSTCVVCFEGICYYAITGINKPTATVAVVSVADYALKLSPLSRTQRIDRLIVKTPLQCRRRTSHDANSQS